MSDGQYEINPLTRSNWRRYIRAKRVFRNQFVFLLTMLVMTLFFLGVWLSAGVAQSNLSQVGRHFFQSLAGLLTFFLSINSIGVNLMEIAGEREKQTFDALALTPLNPRELLFGKLYGSLVSVMMLALLALPFFAVVFFLGGVSWGDVLVWGLVIWVIPTLFGLGAISISALAKTTRQARMLLGGILIGSFVLYGMVDYHWGVFLTSIVLIVVGLTYMALRRLT